MRRIVWSSLVSLSLAALGLTASSGQDAPPAEASPGTGVVQEVQVSTQGVVIAADGDAPRKPGAVVEIEVNENGKPVVERPIRAEFQNGKIVIIREDGRTTAAGSEGKPSTRNSTTENVRFYAHAASEKEAREALEQIIASLRTEVDELSKTGKTDEAARKRRQLEALAQLLTAHPAVEKQMVTRTVTVTQVDSEELSQLKKRRADLAEALQKTPADNPEVQEKLKRELVELDSRIADVASKARHGQFYAVEAHAATPLGVPLPPQVATGGPGTPGWQAPPQFHGRHHVGQSAVLAQQAEALTQAASRLKESGLHDQARHLMEHAEKLRDESAAMANREREQQRLRARTGGHAEGFITVAVPPDELLRSIRELQEQVQSLRKEVAELREILRNKPTENAK